MVQDEAQDFKGDITS